jgi:hypothetical protein
MANGASKATTVSGLCLSPRALKEVCWKRLRAVRAGPGYRPGMQRLRPYGDFLLAIFVAAAELERWPVKPRSAGYPCSA